MGTRTCLRDYFAAISPLPNSRLAHYIFRHLGHPCSYGHGLSYGATRRATVRVCTRIASGHRALELEAGYTEDPWVRFRCNLLDKATCKQRGARHWLLRSSMDSDGLYGPRWFF